MALPGGSVEAESATDGAAREILEEVGLANPRNLRPLDFWYDENLPDKRDAHYVCVFFECEAPDNWEPTNCEPHKCDGWEWEKLCDVGFQDLMPGTEAVLERVWTAKVRRGY